MAEREPTLTDWYALARRAWGLMRRPLALVSLVYGALWAGLAVEFAGERPGAAMASAVLSVVCLALGWQGLRSKEKEQHQVPRLPPASQESSPDPRPVSVWHQSPDWFGAALGVLVVVAFLVFF